MIIDMHCHILPGIDDGAKDINESLDMAREAVKQGIKIVVATPHKINGSYDIPFKDIVKKTNELNTLLKKKKINLTVIPGSENYAEIEIDTKCTINNKNYFLIEFPMRSYPSYCEHIIDELISKKIIPIINHPETCSGIKKDINIIESLIDKGCLIMLNADSLIETHGKRVSDFASFLLKNNAYHLFSSNAHSVEGYKNISTIIKKLEEFIGSQKTMEITQKIPEKVIKGEVYKPPKIKFNSSYNQGLLKSIFKKLI